MEACTSHYIQIRSIILWEAAVYEAAGKGKCKAREGEGGGTRLEQQTSEQSRMASSLFDSEYSIKWREKVRSFHYKPA